MFPKDSKFKISEYEMPQVGLKDSMSQNFSLLALKEMADGTFD
jgi:hypothetical protein